MIVLLLSLLQGVLNILIVLVPFAALVALFFGVKRLIAVLNAETALQRKEAIGGVVVYVLLIIVCAALYFWLLPYLQAVIGGWIETMERWTISDLWS